MEIRLEMWRILNPTVIARELDRLDARLEKKGRSMEPMLLFAGTFFHHNMGNLKAAKRYAALLQSLVGPEEKTMYSYASYVLSGERAGAVRTRPAR